MLAHRTIVAGFLGGLLAASAAVANAQDTRDDMRIHLKAAVFDPREGPGEIPDALRLAPPLATERRIIQFRAPLTREQRERLRSQYGLRLDDYIPNQAYLERIPEDASKKLRRLDLVRAIVDYQPAFKISPTIGKVKFRTEERRKMAGLLLLAVLFDDADPEAVAASIRAVPGAAGIDVSDLRQLKGAARIQFVLPSTAGLPEVARLDGVRWIEEVAEQIEDNGNTAGTIQSGTPGTVPVWDRGIHGEGQIVGVVDSGPVDTNHCMFQDPVNNTPSPTHRKVLQVRGGGAANGHATFVAGIVLGDDFNNPGTGANRGNAWAARLVSGRRAEGMLNALNANIAQGATIHTNSWHDNTQGAGNPALYNQTASDVDNFTWNNEDHLVLGSMGNNGEEQGPPGTAKNAIGVNASLRDPNEMGVGDGNPGPTADGRRKPDVVTPGCQINSAQVSTACTIQLRGCATSWATPAAAATAGLIRQYYAEGWYPTGTARPEHAFTPSGALVKATLLNGTIDMTGAGLAGYPTNNEGWGLARLENVLFFPGRPRHLRAWEVRNANGLASGEFQAFTVSVASSVEPLKVTLAWSEPPAAAGAAVPTINNLNLTVIAPDGTTFLGNVFAGGVSTPGGVADAINNVEQVLIDAPDEGNWTIRVGAPAVNVGLPGQGFAVVATATMSAPQIQVPAGARLGATCVGGASRTTLNVCNTGRDDLIVSPITSSNPRFSVTTPSSGYPVVISHDFCFPFEVSFQPTGVAPQAGTLTIDSNDPLHPTTVVPVSGSGAERDIRVTGSTAFGVTSGWRPAEKTVSVCNTGGCDLAVSSASVACADFTVVDSPFPATLGPGSCLDVGLEFTPTLPGRRSCLLTIASDDPDTPATARTLTARTPPFLTLHAGIADPHGALGGIADIGSTFTVGFVNPFLPNWAWHLSLGYSRLDGLGGSPDTRVWTARANVRFTLNPAAPVRVFVNGGPALYHFTPGSVEGGLSVGAGLSVPAGRRFAFEGTYNYNVAVSAAPDLEFSQFQAGLLISF